MEHPVEKKIASFLEQSVVGISTASLAVIVLISIVSVISRFLFNKPLFWGMELSSCLAVWLTFIVSGYNHKHDIHFKVDLLYNLFGAKLKRIDDIIVTIITVFCVSICLYSGIIASLRNYNISMAAMEISVSITLYLPVVVGYITYLIFMLFEFTRFIRTRNQEAI